MMKSAMVAILLALPCAPASAAVIDFAGYTTGTRVDGPLSLQGATFQSSTGSLLIDDFGAGKAICPATTIGCSGSLSIFFNRGATGLGVDVSGDTVAGSQTLFGGESDRLGFRGVLRADGDPTTVSQIRLRFENVRLLTLASNDPGRVGYGNISFTAAAVPEPASWAMMIAGVGLVGGRMRRRKTSFRTTASFA